MNVMQAFYISSSLQSNIDLICCSWTIRGRVTNKGQVKSYSNAKGEGKLFSFTVMDETGDIRVTGFRETVDKFYEMIQLGKVYYIANASLKYVAFLASRISLSMYFTSTIKLPQQFCSPESR